MRRCEYCDQEFSPKRQEQRFCGNSCSAKATARKRGQVGIVTITCAQCNEQFQSYAGNHRKYCSKECESASHRTERPKCEICGKPVRLMRNRYCSKSCSNAARKRPGITSLSGLYQRAQKANPDAEPCAVCGEPGEHRHHADYSKPELVTWLCTLCHRRHHQLGKKRSEYKHCPIKIAIL